MSKVSAIAHQQSKQLAQDVISMAQSGGMPDSWWLTDTRIARACKVLGITPEKAREEIPGARRV